MPDREQCCAAFPDCLHKMLVKPRKVNRTYADKIAGDLLAEERKKRIEQKARTFAEHLRTYVDAGICDLNSLVISADTIDTLLDELSRREQEHQVEVCDAWQEGWNIGYADAKRKDKDSARWPTPNPHKANHSPHA